MSNLTFAEKGTQDKEAQGMILNDDVRRPGSRDQQSISGWTSLHSWIFLAIVVLGVLIMAFQNRYHYLSPLGLGKAYRIDKIFGGIQEYDPGQGWIAAQLQPLPPQQAMSMPGPEGSQAMPMHMPGSLPPSPPAMGMGTVQAPEVKEEPAAPLVTTKEATPKSGSVQSTRTKESAEMTLEEKIKAFKKAFPDFGKEEFQLANDDLYPDWKKSVAPNGTWSEFLGTYRDFVQWWIDQGSPAESGSKLWKEFLASRGKR